MKKLVQFMEFFKGVSPFAVPAYRFIQTAKETLGYREGDFSEKTPSPFIFQYDFFYRMIDEEVLLKLYEGWLKKEAVSFTYLPEKQYRENRTGLVKWNDPSLKIEERQITAVPFGVTHTDLYGRRYLFAYVLDSAQKEIAKNREALFRLDRISNVEEIHSLKTGAIRKKEGAKKGKENPAPSVDAVYKQAPRLKKRLNKSWNSSLSGKEQYRYFETEIVFPETFRETSPEEAAFFNRMKNRRDTYETLGDHRYRLFGIFQTEREAKKWAEGFQGVCTDPKPVSYGEILFDFSQDSERIQAFLERFPKEQTASLGRNRYLYRNYVSDAQTLLQDMAPFVSSVDFLELDEYVHKYDYEITLRFSEEACEKHAFLNQRKEEALFAKETQRIASFEKGFLMRYESPEDGVHQLKLSHAFQTQKDLEQWILSLRKKIGQEDEVEITFEIKSPFLEVIFDFKECPSRKERFFREGKNGMIRKLGGDRYLFRIYLADQKEILPWLYSFGKAVAEIDCRETIRKKELESCAGSVLKNYGIF